MTARLTTLPDELRGGAWPSPARAVRCPVKSGKLGYRPPWISSRVSEGINSHSLPEFLGFILIQGKKRAVAGAERARPPPLVATQPPRGLGHTRGTAGAKPEEGGGYGRSVCPETPGLHARYNGRDNGIRPRKGKGIP